MRTILALLFTVAGCAAAPQPAERPTQTDDVPHACPPIPKPPPPLNALVLPEDLRAWAEATEKARVETVTALKTCDRRIKRYFGEAK